MCIVALPQHPDQTVLPQDGEATASDCPAHLLTPAQRRGLALDALAGQPISQIAQRYGVMSIPTLILFKDGEPAAAAVGAMPKTMLEERLGLAEAAA